MQPGSQEQTMIETTRHILTNGETLPDLSLPSVSGGTVSLREYVKGAWSIVLFYRGNWCPFCNAQLNAFQRKLPEFEKLGVRVIAISADPLNEAQQTVEKHHLTFPVLYGASPAFAAKTYGAYTDENAHGAYVNSTGFILEPNGAIAIAVYSSGAIGRIVPDDALGLVKYMQSQATSQ
jgi:peroxiredoxin